MASVNPPINPSPRSRRFQPVACAFALAALVALASCNTVSGIGADIQDASEATREALRSDTDQPKTSSTNDGTRPEGD